MWHNIPAELRQYPHWCVSGPDKIPLTPRTGQPAKVNDPSTWGTFEEATRSGYKYIGFVLSENDPYTIIDLDNKPERPATEEELERHMKILGAFESYIERSASGRGYHIIVKGRVPAGVHKSNVEVYSSSRYMICTGNVFKFLPIVDYQALLDKLYGEMKPAETIPLEDRESPLDDLAVLEMAMRAENGEKFDSLCKGEWQGVYPSQSEADFALLAILAFYTPDNEQVRRLFRYSKLGQREKALKNDVYLNRCLGKIRAVQPKRLDFDEIKAMAAKVVNEKADAGVRSQGVPLAPPAQFTPGIPRNSTPENPDTGTLTPPPGLVGDIAQYFFATAVRPVPDIALASALAFVAGVCGRSYNISGVGLNQYIILLARTGSGKEGATTGIDNLIAAVRPQVPMVDEFIGPGAFASGQALIKVLDERPCFVSVLGEFGLTLQQMCSPEASSPQIMLKRALLDLYSKSGWNKVLRSSVYSDTDKNTKIVQAPNVTILAESTPETFFGGLDVSHITEGLIPRFSVIEYTGLRPPRNENANCPPSPELANRVAELVAIALTNQNQNLCMAVQLDKEAQHALDSFDKEADTHINTTQNEDAESQLWNRAHLKALKLSAVIAVGVNPHQPIVSGPIAEWALRFVRRDIMTMTKRFTSGDVGQGDSKQHNDVKRAIKWYLTVNYEMVRPYGIDELVFRDRVIPYVLLQRRTANLSSFRNDRRGAIGALKNILQSMIDGGVLNEVSPQQASERYKLRAKLYVIGKAWSDV